MTEAQIALIAWTLVMVVQMAHGSIAARGTGLGPNDPPPRKQYPMIVHVLIAGVIAVVLGSIAEALGWVEE